MAGHFLIVDPCSWQSIQRLYTRIDLTTYATHSKQMCRMDSSLQDTDVSIHHSLTLYCILDHMPKTKTGGRQFYSLLMSYSTLGSHASAGEPRDLQQPSFQVTQNTPHVIMSAIGSLCLLLYNLIDKPIRPRLTSSLLLEPYRDPPGAHSVVRASERPECVCL